MRHTNRTVEVSSVEKRNYIVLLFTFAAIWLGICTAPVYAQERLPIRHDGRTIGAITKIDITSDSSDSSRALISIWASFRNFPSELDRFLKARGNMGSRTHRLYWRGGTSMLRGGSSLRMASRVRYEWWPDTGIFGRVQTLRDTRTVDWEVFLYPTHLSQLRLAYRLRNIRGIGNDLERLFGLRKTWTTNITLPGRCGRCDCKDLLDDTNPTLESTQFSQRGTDVDFMATLAINADLAEAVRCIPR